MFLGSAVRITRYPRRVSRESDRQGGQTNLRVLGSRSRTKPQPGDVFAMQPAEGLFLFGQVVLAEFYGPMPQSYLIYVYDHRSSTQVPDLARLTKDHLLLPPLFINRMPWTRGYFKNVAHRDLVGQVLPEHRLGLAGATRRRERRNV